MEAYSVAVRVSLIDGAASGLMALARQFKTTHLSAMELKKELKSIELLMLGGGLMAATGIFGLNMLKGPLEEAKKFQTEVAKFKTFGLGDAMNIQAVKFAQGANIVGASATDMMAYVREAQGAFRESGNLNPMEQLTGAKIAAPILAQIHFAQSALGRGEVSEADDRMMMRFIEDRGATTDAAKFRGTADMGYKMINSSGGLIHWGDLQSLITRSAAIGRTMSDDAIAKLEPVMAALTGATVGTGLRTASNRLLGLQRGIPKIAIQEYLDLGLWNKKDIEFNSQGGIKRFLPNFHLKNEAQEYSDPTQWYIDTFLPALVKLRGKGIMGNDAASIARREKDISLTFGGGSTGATVYTRIDQMLPIILRSVAAQRKALGITGSSDAANATLEGKEIALQKNWQTLMLQLGETILPAAISGMGTLNGMLGAMIKLTRAHPTATKIGVESFAGFSAFLAAGGMITMTAGAFRALGGAAMAARAFPFLLSALATGLEVGAAVIAAPVTWIVAAVAAVGVAAYEIWKHWDSSKSVFQNIKSELGMFWSFLTGLPGQLWNALPGWARGALGAAGKAITGGLGNTAQGFRSGAPPVNLHVHNKVDRHGLMTMVTDGLGHILGSDNNGGRNSDPRATRAQPGAAAMGGHG